MSWQAQALRVLETAEAEEKCRIALSAVEPGADADDSIRPPARPARPDRPLLILPRDAPRRRLGSVEGRAALLHALAHIELNAVDLAFDMALRFAPEARAAGLSESGFVRDWFRVGSEEAKHFLLLNARLKAFGSHYGALAAHDGLWEAAEATSDSLLARLAIAPMVLEARGLDVTPGMAAKLMAAGDEESARVLETIYAEEIGHVAAGVRWFEALCGKQGRDPGAAFAALVTRRFRGRPKPPFNVAGRNTAGMGLSYYARWNEPCAATANRR